MLAGGILLSSLKRFQRAILKIGSDPSPVINMPKNRPGAIYACANFYANMRQDF
jgi:hypothetical protein